MRFRLFTRGCALQFVVTALPLAAHAPAADPPSAAEVERAIESGVQHLRSIYLAGDGRGDAHAFGQPSILHHPGLHALAAYALLRAGVPRDDAAVRALFARLASDAIESTYDAACLVLALCALDPIEHRAWLAELRVQLVAWQEADGDFGYPGGGDLSNTQFAALALHALADAGFEFEPAMWERLARAVLRYREKDGGFGYVVRARESTGTMTTAGIGTLAICELELARGGALSAELERGLRDARRDGIAWLAANFEPDRNPAGASWAHYWLYGVERVGALCAQDAFGARDWYGEGARFLVDTQGGDGAWAGTFERIPTVFALLFLRRATRATAPVTGPDVARGSPVRLFLEGEAPVTLALQVPSETRVVRVEYLADGEVVAVALGDPDRPAGAERFACKRWFARAGTRRFDARVIVHAADGTGGELRSDVIEHALGRGVPEWNLALEQNTTLTNVPLERAQAKASSTLGGVSVIPLQGCGARFALDGNPRTPWLAEADDAAPALSIRLKRAEHVERVRVHLAQLVGAASTDVGRPAAVELRVERGAWIRRESFDDPRRPLEWELAPGAKVRSLELRLVDVTPAGAPAGIGEVVLLR